MCGIAGALLPRKLLDADELMQVATRLSDSLSHRGPDGKGTWIDSDVGIALGHSRLAVIGLGDGGRQPMISADGRWVLVYNGELYNHAELRAQLEGRGVLFRGGSDTEVLLEACAVWGLETTLQRIDGMYAFALWDRSERRLQLVRDRFGEKPLYFVRYEEGIAFGSELRSMRFLPNFDLRIDRQSIGMLLRDGCIPAPHSIYKAIKKVEPATYLSASLESQELRTESRRYWRLNDLAEGNNPIRPEKVVIDELESHLKRAVGSRMVAEVPLGAFLSGGVDSSLVVALMQQVGNQPVNTFTMGFEVPGFDEAPQAREVSKALGTNHTEIYVSSLSAQQVVPDLPDIYDEPFADSSQIPTVLISRIACERVKVCLSGDGGDEVFAGYNRYALVPRARALADRLGPLAIPFARTLSSLSPALWDSILRIAERLVPSRVRLPPDGDSVHKLASVLMASPAELYAVLTAQWQRPESVVIGAPAVYMDPWLSSGDAAITDPVQQMRYLDTRGYLPDDILVKLDRASMSVGLETRVPFLDPELVRFAWRVPLSQHMGARSGKRLLREVLARHLPRRLFERPKTGFAAPIGSWLRGPLHEWAADLLAEDRLRREGFFHVEPIQKYWREHLSGRRNWQYQLWTVLMFQAWLARWHG